jgi:hypothetical protein
MTCKQKTKLPSNKMSGRKLKGSLCECGYLRCLHGIMLGEVDLQLVRLASIQGARRSSDLDYPPVQSSRKNSGVSQVIPTHLLCKVMEQ